MKRKQRRRSVTAQLICDFDFANAKGKFSHDAAHIIIVKRLDPLQEKKTFTRKNLGHTMVSASKASSVTL